MSRYDEDFHPVRVKHIPIAPPRAGTPGEGIYLRLWQQWATANPGEWQAIFTFGTTHRPRQRAASVAASFMVFMGCNGGAGFTHKAEQQAASGAYFSRESAFISAWALYNRRQRGVSSGLRIAEYILAAEHPIGTLGLDSGRVMWSRVPSITQDDNDYLESMVAWWSTEPAQRLRERAEPLIAIAHSLQWDSYHGRGPANPRPEVERVARVLEHFA